MLKRNNAPWCSMGRCLLRDLAIISPTMTVLNLFLYVVTRRLLAGGLAVSLALLPGGSAACWPLPNGQHLHVGWVDAHGHGATHLHIIIHTDRFFAEVAHGMPGIGAARLVGVALPLPMLAMNLWSMPAWAVTLTWLGRVWNAPHDRTRRVRPPTPPPRAWAAPNGLFSLPFSHLLP